MNNTTNRIKKRADTLAEYIVNKVERLEKKNDELELLGSETYHELRRHEMAFEKVLDTIAEVKKDKDGTIIIQFCYGVCTIYESKSPMYPLIEMLLEKYRKRKVFERVVDKLRKGSKPIEPLK